MPASIGVNLRVTGHCRQGGRKYMEDFFSVAYQQTEDERDLEYAFFGIYDGHGGAEAAFYAKEHLMETIVRQKNFWSDNDEDVLRAIKDGYVATHYAMWKEQEKWPKTASGLPSTAGTTASVAFIRRGKIYIGHVGDSGIILGYQDAGSSEWKARPLTKDHKPESALEMSRIEQSGGKVVSKSGVPRVVWNRPRIGHQGPVRRSTPIDEIPFLAVARSLGDLWSYNSQLDEFVVSPDPDCSVIPIDTNTFRCLIFGTDGLYNMVSPQMAVHIVQQAERHNENAALSDEPNKVWLNPSKCLVEKALERWSTTKMRADNTSVVTLMLDPPGPPRAQVLKNKKKKNTYADSGLEIVTRYEDHEKSSSELANCNELNTQRSNTKDSVGSDAHHAVRRSCSEEVGPSTSCHNDDRQKNELGYNNVQNKHKNAADSFCFINKYTGACNTTKILTDVSTSMPTAKCTENITNVTTTEFEDYSDIRSTSKMGLSNVDKHFMPKLRESTSYDPRMTDTCTVNSASGPFNSSPAANKSETNGVNRKHHQIADENIQINEISSSSNDILDVSMDCAEQERPTTNRSSNGRLKNGQTQGPKTRSSLLNQVKAITTVDDAKSVLKLKRTRSQTHSCGSDGRGEDRDEPVKRRRGDKKLMESSAPTRTICRTRSQQNVLANKRSAANKHDGLTKHSSNPRLSRNNKNGRQSKACSRRKENLPMKNNLRLSNNTAETNVKQTKVNAKKPKSPQPDTTVPLATSVKQNNTSFIRYLRTESRPRDLPVDSLGRSAVVRSLRSKSSTEERTATRVSRRKEQNSKVLANKRNATVTKAFSANIVETSRQPMVVRSQIKTRIKKQSVGSFKLRTSTSKQAVNSPLMVNSKRNRVVAKTASRSSPIKLNAAKLGHVLNGTRSTKQTRANKGARNVRLRFAPTPKRQTIVTPKLQLQTRNYKKGLALKIFAKHLKK